MTVNVTVTVTVKYFATNQMCFCDSVVRHSVGYTTQRQDHCFKLVLWRCHADVNFFKLSCKKPQFRVASVVGLSHWYQQNVILLITNFTMMLLASWQIHVHKKAKWLSRTHIKSDNQRSRRTPAKLEEDDHWKCYFIKKQKLWLDNIIIIDFFHQDWVPVV